MLDATIYLADLKLDRRIYYYRLTISVFRWFTSAFGI